MRPSQRLLFSLALVGWAGAIRAHVAGGLTSDEAARIRWTLARNRWLLLSSISMNAFVFRAIYRYVNAHRRR
ncbi:hypothetical protein [Halovivax gelatinilyticus]|uniref:hypothetical protein n=1 Tax=Halovivax gelatinilyticus TaxID=2961597 RepID=UPI0020CA451D|nr:hypothetical protein [Halovivax gelatinilyticus]